MGRKNRSRQYLEVQPATKKPLTEIIRHLRTVWDKEVTPTEALNWSIIQTHKQLAAEAAMVGLAARQQCC